MTIGQLTAIAMVVFGLGVYASVRGFLTHLKLRKALKDRKNSKLPKERTISTLMLLAWIGSVFLEDQLLNRLELPIPELFVIINKGVSAGFGLAIILLVINHFKPSGIERDEKMLFLEVGFLIILSYLILSNSLMLIYLKVASA